MNHFPHTSSTFLNRETKTPSLYLEFKDPCTSDELLSIRRVKKEEEREGSEK